MTFSVDFEERWISLYVIVWNEIKIGKFKANAKYSMAIVSKRSESSKQIFCFLLAFVADKIGTSKKNTRNTLLKSIAYSTHRFPKQISCKEHFSSIYFK